VLLHQRELDLVLEADRLDRAETDRHARLHVVGRPDLVAAHLEVGLVAADFSVLDTAQIQQLQLDHDVPLSSPLLRATITPPGTHSQTATGNYPNRCWK